MLRPARPAFILAILILAETTTLRGAPRFELRAEAAARGEPGEEVVVPFVCGFFSTGFSLTLVPEPRRRFVRGNANGSGKVDLSDPIWILNELFASGAPSPCQDAADANDGGGIDLSDPLYLIRYMLLGGRPPPAPFAECGTDRLLDALECEEPADDCDD